MDSNATGMDASTESLGSNMHAAAESWGSNPHQAEQMDIDLVQDERDLRQVLHAIGRERKQEVGERYRSVISLVNSLGHDG